MSSLYERIGGQDAINIAVDIFYRKMLSDERVNYFFNQTDMAGQIAKQTSFLTMACDGPNNYSGKDMRNGHKHLLEKGLKDKHVDIVIEHLGETLKELGVSDGDIIEIAAIVNSARDDVLNR